MDKLLGVLVLFQQSAQCAPILLNDSLCNLHYVERLFVEGAVGNLNGGSDKL